MSLQTISNLLLSPLRTRRLVLVLIPSMRLPIRRLTALGWVGFLILSLVLIVLGMEETVQNPRFALLGRAVLARCYLALHVLLDDGDDLLGEVFGGRWGLGVGVHVSGGCDGGCDGDG